MGLARQQVLGTASHVPTACPTSLFICKCICASVHSGAHGAKTDCTSISPCVSVHVSPRRAKRLKAMLHLWPMLLATACASACACVLVHASLTHLRQVLRIEEEDEEANRRARQAIIDRVRSATSASPADVTVVGGTAGLGLEAGASSGGATSSSEPGLAPAEPTGGATNTESSLKQPLLPQ